jgi:mannitol-specific phosphotransferase system IIBC component
MHSHLFFVESTFFLNIDKNNSRARLRKRDASKNEKKKTNETKESEAKKSEKKENERDDNTNDEIAL